MVSCKIGVISLFRQLVSFSLRHTLQHVIARVLLRVGLRTLGAIAASDTTAGLHGPCVRLRWIS